MHTKNFVFFFKRGGEMRSHVMEYSETAPPTCYRVLYYYGDFSVAPSFVQTVEGRDKTRTEQKKR